MNRNIKIGGAAAAAAAAATAGILLATSTSTPTQRYVAVSGTDTGDCSSSSAPCATLGYAAAQSACGNTIHVSDGNYAQQTIDATIGGDCSTTHRIKIKPVTGAKPILAGLIVNGSHLDIYGLTDDGGNVDSGAVAINYPAVDVVYEHGFVKNARLLVNAASGVRVSHTDLGPSVGSATHVNAVTKIQNDGKGHAPVGVRFTFDTFHDFSTSNGTLAHPECLYLDKGSKISIDHSSFWGCQDFAIFGKPNGESGVVLDGVKITNDRFGQEYQNWSATSGFSGGNGNCVELDPTSGTSDNNVLIAFDSFYFEPGLVNSKNHGCQVLLRTDQGGTYTNTAVTANTGIVHVNAECAAGTAWTFNLEAPFSAGQVTPCGTNNTLAPATSPNSVIGFTVLADLPQGDYTLNETSKAVAYAPLASCPATDIVNKHRPNVNHPSACDAGAYENR